jgi:beta-mannosidase
VLFRSDPDQHASPADFNINNEKICDAIVPGTVAMSVNGSEPECWHPHIDYDDYDWWYYSKFDDQTISSHQQLRLCFEGLATFCEIWLNGKKIHFTENMFRGYDVDISQLLNKENDLFLVFRSVNQFLQEKRPRPKWKTKLVENQQMRWVRSTVLGHVSVWTPPVKAIGPWKSVSIEKIDSFEILECLLTTNVIDDIPELSFSAELSTLEAAIKIDKAEIIIDNICYPLLIDQQKNKIILSGKQNLADLKLWWPHTHGEQNLYSCEVIITVNGKASVLDSRVVGFKSSKFVFSKECSTLKINNQAIFCRGTCWTVSDYLSLNASRESLFLLLSLMRDGGLNMIRVGGTMVYESNDFYDICDELGILVWQDFMFASMDYPIDDDAFSSNVKAEVEYQLKRLSQYACIAVYCGNTDVEAQAAMYGMAKEVWSNDLFAKWIPALCTSLHPAIPYLPSSPTGGTMPFHLAEGVTHYWGVGAYMHQSNDSDKYRVRFASEGMGLSHIPEDEIIHQTIGKSTLYPYDNEWTKRIPRDLGAGWDFNDIRDYYMEDVFCVDAVHLRRNNVEKYMALSRVVTGEVLSQVFKTWRSFDSSCSGGLIWFNRDFWPCAGFGLIDSNNKPKAAYYQLRKIWAKQLVILTNEGLDGASITVINETKDPLVAQVEIELIKDSQVIISSATEDVEIKENSLLKLSVDEMLGRFYDTGYAYKFGTPQFDVMSCRLKGFDGAVIHEDFMYLESQSLPVLDDAKVSAIARSIDDETLLLTISSSHLLQFVRIVVKGHQPEDNYFHLSPNQEKRVLLKKIASVDKKFRGQIEAVNLSNSIKIKMHE